MFSIGVAGAGTWGLASARVLSLNGNNVTVWSAIPSEIDELVETCRNNRLPGVVVPDNIVFTESIEEVCKKKTSFYLPCHLYLYVRQQQKFGSLFLKVK